MNVSAWSIRNPIPAMMVFILLTLVGVMGFRAMKIQNFMDIDLPMVTVTASLPGASPQQMETEVTRKIENAVATLQNVRHIYGRATDGTTVVTVEFRLEKPTQEALDDVRDAVARVRSDLPGDLRDPVIAKVNLAGTPILTYTVSSPRMDEEQLSWFVDDTIARKLLGVRGVGAVNRVGGLQREVQVLLDPARMLALNVTASDVSRQLRRVEQDAAGGRANIGGAEQSLRTLSTARTAAELGALDMTLSDGRHIRLDQVASIADTTAERRSMALLDGKPVVAFEIVRALKAGEVDTAAGIDQALAQIRTDHPDVVFTEAFNFVEPVQENYEGSMHLLYEGAVLAIIVVFLFLRDWRATLVSATALPLSVIPAFGVMHFVFGFTINVVTLLSLSLVVGILVDDAIVEIENIMRHLKMGKSPYQAAMEAADEIGMAVIATTFTLIAVFLPTAFMSGIAGKFFVQFGWTAAIAVFFSLVVARMLTPMMAAYLLRPPRHRDAPPRWMARYETLVRWCLRHRVLTLALTAAFFVGGLALVGLLPKGFLPQDDVSQTQVSISLPPGATIGQTRATAEQVRELVAKVPHVRQVYTAIGGGATGSDPFAPPGASDVRKATLTISLDKRDARAGVSKQAVEERIRAALVDVPGARLKVGLGGSNDSYVFSLSGDDGRALDSRARIVERDARSLAGVGNVTSSASLVRPELIVRPDLAQAAALGVTPAAIADTLRVATSGDFEQALAKLNATSRQIPIVVRLPEEARADLALLERLPVPGARGPVPLSSVATLSLESGPAQIERRDRRRNVNFEIELNGEQLGEVQSAVARLPSVQSLPSSIEMASVGDAEAMGELFESFALAMLTGVLCIYIVLVMLFHSFIQPVTILGALVLSVPGAVIALALTGTALSMPSMIGLIMLMGIATKNSILLVDYVILAQREHGLGRFEAILDACRKRAQPIIMTTIAMAAGMLPIALGMGVDPSFRRPMAIVVVGGLITSTFLSLLVIPVLYTLVDDLTRWIVRGLSRFGGHHHTPGTPVPAPRSASSGPDA